MGLSRGILCKFSLFTLLACVPLLAQFDTAGVLGTVYDNSGSAVSKATVKLTNQDTAIEATTLSADNGEFTFSNVRIGRYSVSAEATGFSTAIAKDIAVNVNARQRVDLTLQVGSVSQEVEVTGAAALLETDSSERGQVVDSAHRDRSSLR